MWTFNTLFPCKLPQHLCTLQLLPRYIYFLISFPIRKVTPHYYLTRKNNPFPFFSFFWELHMRYYLDDSIRACTYLGRTLFWCFSRAAFRVRYYLCSYLAGSWMYKSCYRLACTVNRMRTQCFYLSRITLLSRFGFCIFSDRPSRKSCVNHLRAGKDLSWPCAKEGLLTTGVP